MWVVSWDGWDCVGWDGRGPGGWFRSIMSIYIYKYMSCMRGPEREGERGRGLYKLPEYEGVGVTEDLDTDTDTSVGCCVSGRERERKRPETLTRWIGFNVSRRLRFERRFEFEEVRWVMVMGDERWEMGDEE